MRIGVIQFPGSNCERETILALKRAALDPMPFLWNETPTKLFQMDGYVIVGGFSYEDRSRAGIIAALDPIMQTIKAESEKGKPVLGICNGAQILVETGMVPGLTDSKVGMALTENKRVKRMVIDGQEKTKILGTGYYNNWIYVRLSQDYQRNAFTYHLSSKDILHIPIAHAEGRFVMSAALLAEVTTQGLHVFQYCDDQGAISEHFPVNPNGSIANIAAISNKAGNVMAIMPHPERTPNGDVIFRSMRDYIAEEKKREVMPLYYYPRPIDIKPYQKPATTYELVVELIITDNQAITVQNTLRQLGIPVRVKRQIHWEIECDSEETYQAILKSGELYNERKERDVTASRTPCQKMSGEMGSRLRGNDKEDKHPSAFLVRARDDLVGKAKVAILKEHFGIQGLKEIRHGILWHFSSEIVTISGPGAAADEKLGKTEMDKILYSNIIFNKYAHDCYQY